MNLNAICQPCASLVKIGSIAYYRKEFFPQKIDIIAKVRRKFNIL